MALGVTACAPVPRLGHEILDEDLFRIERGKTTDTEVKAVLGEPDIIWEPKRVWVYEEGPSFRILWVIPGYYQAFTGMTDVGEDVVILRFDEEGRVERMERRVGPVRRGDYGDFLRFWLSDESITTESNERTPAIDLGR